MQVVGDNLITLAIISNKLRLGFPRDVNIDSSF